MNWDKINWDVVWSTLRSLLMAGGPMGTMLIAFGFPPLEVGTWTAAGLAVIGVASLVVPGIFGALKQTDKGKLTAVASMPEENRTAAVATLPDHVQTQIASALPDDKKIEAVNNLPEVQQVITVANPTNGVAKAVADPTMSKVVSL